MKTQIESFVLSLMPEEYKPSFEVNILNQGDKTIGYSYSVFSRCVLRIKTDMKKVFRIELYNYQDKTLSNDLKTLIHTDYPIKEATDGLITIDVEKNENILLQTIYDNEQAIREKLFDIYINYSPVISFGCCSRYETCSDALKCLLADIEPLRARGCLYRKNLESGKIFYGKNKNC